MPTTCSKCGYDVPEGFTLEEVIVEETPQQFHRVFSSIQGGGSRLCGPVTESE